MVSQRPLDGRRWAGFGWSCRCGVTFDRLSDLDRHHAIGACGLSRKGYPAWKRWLLGILFDLTKRIT